LFDWPTDPRTKDLVIDDQLVNASGKMMVLERLLDELFARGHKVLIFSQFKIGLDIIEVCSYINIYGPYAHWFVKDWAVEFKGWPICRIDGETDAVQRREEMHRFQTGGDAPDAPRLFLLTTRAGGQGINLTAADTVIFYDQDWNPQMDAQAADRAHRIGQTRPVLIFRLVSKHTIEARIMQRAAAKRQLEALVIAKGKFRAPTAATSTKATAAEAAAALLELEAERIEVVPDNEAGKASVLSDEDLNALLDRSPEVYAGRGKGWTQAKDAGTKGDAFAVFETPVESGNAALANMLGEEELPS
jgi:ATP-dependent DNA helicase